MSTTTESVRLHITPLTPESYSIIVPASLHDSVSAVEYHSIPTFPERRYGYIDLPHEHAERFKKRLNGALVKGARIKVEKARPKQPVGQYTDTEEDKVRDRVVVAAGRTRVADEGLIRGVQLPEGRRVRRGWTEPVMVKKVRKEKGGEVDGKKASRPKKSEFTDKEELLFKTKSKVNSEPGKKRKRDDDTTIVHEFEKTTKFPNFLRGQAADKSKATTEYDPQKGWVDKEGNVVEGPRRSRRNQPDESARNAPSSTAQSKKAASEVTKAARKLTIQTTKSKEPVVLATEESFDETSSSGSDSAEDEEDEGEDDDGSPQSKTTLAKETSHSDLDSSEEDTNRESSTKLTVETTPKPERTIPSLEIVPGSAASDKSAEVHPLEALFKKSKPNAKKPPGLELKIPQPESFTFFGNNADDESEDGDVPTALPLLPQTPFTQADMRFRRERSAAPTPDTAAPTKLLFGPVMDKPLPSSTAEVDDDDDDVDNMTDGDTEAAEPDAAGSDVKKGRSEFAEKWFWENRGDNNRAWKKRRREVSKQKRYEGNKRRTRSSAA